jgi:hypothetical protein
VDIHLIALTQKEQIDGKKVITAFAGKHHQVLMDFILNALPDCANLFVDWEADSTRVVLSSWCHERIHFSLYDLRGIGAKRVSEYRMRMGGSILATGRENPYAHNSHNSNIKNHAFNHFQPVL